MKLKSHLIELKCFEALRDVLAAFGSIMENIDPALTSKFLHFINFIKPI